MGRVSTWAVNHPKKAIAAWLAAAIAIVALAVGIGGTYTNSFNLPDTESTTAQNLLTQIPGAEDALTASTGKIYWTSDGTKANNPQVLTEVNATLEEISSIGGVACVITPSGAPMGNACPEPGEGAGAGGGSPGQASASGEGPADTNPLAGLSPAGAKAAAGLASAGYSLDEQIGYATILFAGTAQDLSATDGKAVLEAVKTLNSQDGITAGVNGQALEFAGTEPPSSEAIGIIVALIILMLAFGSIVGAFLPIGSAILSLAVGQALVLITARWLDVATFAPTLAAMIGLGVGIDYSLFVINRYKQALDAGAGAKDAAREAVATSGRAVVFAAATVIIALLGLFVLRINFFDGLAVAASATVIMMMIGATLLLPAVLSLLGTKAFAWKLPWAKRASKASRGGAFAKYGAWLEKHYRWAGAAALAVIIILALPLASLRLGFTDDSGKQAENPARIAYDLASQGFGPGINGPFIVAADTAGAADGQASVGQLVAALAATPGVALAVPAPTTGPVAAIQVIPETAPSAAETTDLLNTLRDDTIPAVADSTGIKAYVGGTQAITTDFTKVLVDALPLLLLVVIGLGFLTLTFALRSLLVPLTGVVTSLLSLAAAMGVTVAIFQWGWAANLVGVNATGPIMPFLPIMVFAILFGLSMDYHVFLVSRMQEEWGHTGDNRAAVRRGLAASGRVVGIAATIMFSVFAAFILGVDPTIKLFGIALASAVLFDAFIVRLIIVPSVMYQLGRANWWLPGWLDKALPAVRLEGPEEIMREEAEIDDVDDGVNSVGTLTKVRDDENDDLGELTKTR